MKISQLIEVLEDLKKEYGDQYIWTSDSFDFPCPKSFELELVKKIKRTNYGFTGGKDKDAKRVEIYLEYEDGVDVQDRSFTDLD